LPVEGTGRPAPHTAEQLLIAGFADRLNNSRRILDRIERAGYDPTNPQDAIGSRIGIAGNFMMTAQGQLYRQAAENWVRANLRRESGASIGDQEAQREVANYFPQPGEPAAVVRQKAESRRLVEQGLIRAAGSAYQPRQLPAPEVISVPAGTAGALTEAQLADLVDDWETLSAAQRRALRTRLGLPAEAP
jgi:hypothetical protein